MTISGTTLRVSYTGNGATTSFAVPYVFFGNDELVVTETVIATGVETVKTLTTHYTVTGGNDATGAVVAVVAPPNTVTWTIERATDRLQPTDYQNNDPFPAASHEAALDRLTAIVQEIDDTVETLSDFAIQRPASDETGIDMLLPVETERADMTLAFDSDGNVDVIPSLPEPSGPSDTGKFPTVNVAGTGYDLTTPNSVVAFDKIAFATPGVYQWAVPAFVFSVKIKCWGASAGSLNGGPGGMNASFFSGGIGAGNGRGGGAASAVFRANLFVLDFASSEMFIVAGGEGGRGTNSSNPGGRGSGADGEDGTGTDHGVHSASGDSGDTDGTDGTTNSGGGGGGYGAGAGGTGVGGAAGGSGYQHPDATDIVTTTGNDGVANPDYVAGPGSGAGYAEAIFAVTPGEILTIQIGEGGSGASVGDGLVVIKAA